MKSQEINVGTALEWSLDHTWRPFCGLWIM